MNLTSLELAKDRARIFKNYLQIEIDLKANSEKLAFLDRGIKNSPYQLSRLSQTETRRLKSN